MKKIIYSIYLICICLFGLQTSLFAQCNENDATDCECLDNTEADCDLLPDIQASWYGLLNLYNGPSEYPQEGAGSNNGRLRISVSTPNTGVGPLTVRGVDDEGYAYFICDDDTIQVDSDELSDYLEGYYCDNSDEPARQITFQRIYHRNSDGTMSYYDRMAGSMTYHPTHGHNHSDDWGVFTLRIIDENDPNPLNWPVVSDGAKMGFCLMDYGTCGSGTNSTYYGHCRDENRYGSDYLEVFPEFNDGTNGGEILYNDDFQNWGLGGGSYGCSPIEQGISVGWTDVYSENLTDQWINLEPGLCNGTYWIVGEIDRNDNYLESDEDNNWTAIQVTLTEQLDGGGYDITILADGLTTICDGEIVTLSSSTNTADEYLWSNGETTSSIDVGESGEYSLATSNSCGEGQSQSVTVVVNDLVETPIAENVTITAGESAVLNATGSGVILWQNENGDILGEGNSFTSNPLYENTTFYVVNEDELVGAPENLYTGAFEHEGSSYSGGQYNGGLLFNCSSSFTLNSVKIYTDDAGERTIELHNSSGEVLNELLVDVPETGDDGMVIDLNWEINPGDDYLLTTNIQMNNDNFGDNNPMFKRTTDGLANFPFILENVLEITEGYYVSNLSGTQNGSGTEWYYYFYNWEINNEWNIGGTSCFSEAVEVQVIVNDMIYGCTDTSACNYNPDAMGDDGTCGLVDDCGDCQIPYCYTMATNGVEYIAESECDSTTSIWIGNDCENDSYCLSSPENPYWNAGCISIEENYTNLFSVFPNPAIDILNIEFKENMNNASLTLFNHLGERVKIIYTGNIDSNQNFVLNTRNLSSGVYFIRCLNKNTILQNSFTITQ